MLQANRKLADLYIYNSNLDAGLRTLFKRLEYLGLKVTDKSLRGPLSWSSQNTLPIELAATGGSHTGGLLGRVGVGICCLIAGAFGNAFKDTARSCKWQIGAE